MTGTEKTNQLLKIDKSVVENTNPLKRKKKHIRFDNEHPKHILLARSYFIRESPHRIRVNPPSSPEKKTHTQM